MGKNKYREVVAEEKQSNNEVQNQYLEQNDGILEVVDSEISIYFPYRTKFMSFTFPKGISKVSREVLEELQKSQLEFSIA